MSTRDLAPAVDVIALREFLAERDEACPSCSYSLRGLTTDRCPECDEPLVLRVNLAEARLGAWITGLVALVACGGAGAICLLVVVGVSVVENDWPTGDRFFMIVTYPAFVASVAVPAAVALALPRGRRWFRKQGRAARLWVVLGGWMLLGAFAGGFFLLVP